MPSMEEKREGGSAVMIIGWVLMLFAFLVMFFNPAARKLGESRFEVVAGCLAAAGLIMSITGTVIRRRSR